MKQEKAMTPLMVLHKSLEEARKQTKSICLEVLEKEENLNFVEKQLIAKVSSKVMDLIMSALIDALNTGGYMSEEELLKCFYLSGIEFGVSNFMEIVTRGKSFEAEDKNREFIEKNCEKVMQEILMSKVQFLYELNENKENLN
jgi:hypothetical protein